MLKIGVVGLGAGERFRRHVPQVADGVRTLPQLLHRRQHDGLGRPAGIGHGHQFEERLEVHRPVQQRGVVVARHPHMPVGHVGAEVNHGVEAAAGEFDWQRPQPRPHRRVARRAEVARRLDRAGRGIKELFLVLHQRAGHELWHVPELLELLFHVVYRVEPK